MSPKESQNAFQMNRLNLYLPVKKAFNCWAIPDEAVSCDVVDSVVVVVHDGDELPFHIRHGHLFAESREREK